MAASSLVVRPIRNKLLFQLQPTMSDISLLLGGRRLSSPEPEKIGTQRLRFLVQSTDASHPFSGQVGVLPHIKSIFLAALSSFSPGNEVIVDHWKWTKMLTKVFQRNLTQWGYVKPHVKPHPNPPWGKPRLRVKSKKAAIKPVIDVFLINRSHSRTKHRRATYNISFCTTF